MNPRAARTLFFIVLVLAVAANAYPYYMRSRIVKNIEISVLALTDAEGKNVARDLGGALINTVKDQIQNLLLGEDAALVSDKYFVQVRIRNNNGKVLKMVECRYEIHSEEKLLGWGHYEPSQPESFEAGSSTELTVPINLADPPGKQRISGSVVSGRVWLLVNENSKLEVPFQVKVNIRGAGV